MNELELPRGFEPSSPLSQPDETRAKSLRVRRLIVDGISS